MAVVLLSIFLFIPLIRYSVAKSNLEKDNYDKAYSTFVSLGEFRDSESMANEAQYQKAVDLMNSEKYSDAHKIFKKLKELNYKDSKILSNKCYIEKRFAEGKALYSEEKYAEAATEFDSILNSKEEAKEYSNKAHYKAAKQLMEKKDYAEALNHLKKLDKTYKDTETQTKECYYKGGLAAFNEKDYQTAYNYLNNVKDYKDVSDKFSEVCYKYGISLYNKKEWQHAVRILKQAGNYSDSKEKMNAAKYNYVLENKSRTNTITYSYLKDLKSIGYKDSASVYDSLFGWKISVVVNNSEDNETSDSSTISKYDTLYVHIKLSGGPVGEEVKLGYSYRFPNGSTKYGSWDFMMGDGDSSWFSVWYNNPSYGDTGKFYFTVYEKSTGKTLYSDYVYLVN